MLLCMAEECTILFLPELLLETHGVPSWAVGCLVMMLVSALYEFQNTTFLSHEKIESRITHHKLSDEINIISNLDVLNKCI